MSRTERIAALKAAAAQRILMLDGAWGVMIQRLELSEEDFRGERFKDHPLPQKGNNDILILSRPEAVAGLHDQYYAAGADISETNTFSATRIGMADYGLEDSVYDLNLEGARIAREVADAWTAKEPAKPRFVAGAMGPTNRTLSISPDVNDPGARAVTFEQVYDAYREQARALHEGGRRPVPGGDHLRHPERQGGHQGHPRPGGRRLRAAAALGSAAPSPTARAHAVGPDGGGLLELGQPRPAVSPWA
jgi:5-methyltetrahydrofolate--homocysteine methyltransferase